MIRTAVGLGSNLADPPAQLQRAFEALADLPGTQLTARSSLYRSVPIGPPGQPDYCNAAALLDTELSAAALLEALIGIERAAGRRRGALRWGPRILDLDLLAYGDAVIDEPGLRVPHPQIAQRNFVLVPLAEIAPDWELPGLGSVAERAAAIGREGLALWPLGR